MHCTRRDESRMPLTRLPLHCTDGLSLQCDSRVAAVAPDRCSASGSPAPRHLMASSVPLPWQTGSVHVVIDDFRRKDYRS